MLRAIEEDVDFAAKKGIKRREVSDQEIIERCLYSMVNEGCKILEEKKASRASDIDIVWVTGYGWPAYPGGTPRRAVQCVTELQAIYQSDAIRWSLKIMLVIESVRYLC